MNQDLLVTGGAGFIGSKFIRYVQTNAQRVNITNLILFDEADVPSPVKPHAQLIEYVQDRPGHDWRYAMNIKKIRTELGWFPKHDLESGLRKTIEWYLKKSNWLKAIQKRQDYQYWIDDNYQKRGKA